MLTVYVQNKDQQNIKIMEMYPSINGHEVMEKVKNLLGIECNNYYFLKNNGKLIELNNIIYDGDIFLQPRLCGGKGGFGSMLRAIGAQIEKTTNREACRDLSGRRLRDINEEKRLKAWIEKQANKKDEASERKKRKLAKLCAQPKHEFKDKSYDEQRSALTERVEDAVEVGFATASSSAIKRAADKNSKTNLKKKRKTMLDLEDEIDSDVLESSDESSNEETIKKENINNKILDIEEALDVKPNSSNVSDAENKS